MNSRKYLGIGCLVLGGALLAATLGGALHVMPSRLQAEGICPSLEPAHVGCCR
jgi:hypothetical protein